MRRTHSIAGKAAAAAVALALGCAAALAGGCSDSGPDKAKSESRAGRIEAMRDLAGQDSEQSLAAAREAIGHEDIVTACAAVRAVARMSADRSVPVLARAASEDPRPAVREEAAIALSYHPEAGPADVLRRMVQTDPAPNVRAAAAVGIGRTGGLSDVQMLLAACEREQDPLVQGRIVGALERILGIGFTFSPASPEDVRRLTVARIRDAATIRLQVLRAQADRSRRKQASHG